MGLDFHPQQGAIVICDFKGLQEPEMVKRRPVVVISPRFRRRGKLCTIVPLSTTPPSEIANYHYKLLLDPPLPPPNDKPFCWVKADMIYTVSFDRLMLPFEGKDNSGKRIYDQRVLSDDDFRIIQKCLLHGVGLSKLTEHLHST